MHLAIVDQIRALPRAERLAFYRSLPPGLLASQRFAHAFHARDEQALPHPAAMATIEVARGGRRTGKTWWGAMLFNREIFAGRSTRPRIIAATDAAVLAVVIDGPSGVRTWLPPHLRPTFTRSTGYAGTLTYPNGVIVLCCSAQQPGQAIGQGCDLTLADDPAGWVESCGEARASETFRQARVSNSEGRPLLIVPTTRRGVSFLRRLMSPGQMAGVHIRSLGGTRANTSLSPTFLRDTIGDLEGDDWAAEELDDQDRDEAAGALWRRQWIDDNRVATAPDLARIVVAVDPADDGRLDSDETGIVVIGLGFDGRLYVLADYTALHAADRWPAVAAWAVREWKAGCIVAEMNRARSLVRRCIAIEAPNVGVVEADATRARATRAEPLSLLYRDGRVSHVDGGPQLARAGLVRLRAPVFDPTTDRRDEQDFEFARDRRRWTTLEDELCGWVPRVSRSPNGLDALVWGAWHLAPPDGPSPWAGSSAPRGAPTPALQGRYAGVDPRRAAQQFRRVTR